MPKRNILVLDQKDSPWIPFLEECFEDTPSMLRVINESAPAQASLDRTRFDMAFFNPSLPTLSLVQKLKVHRQSTEGFRLFSLGPEQARDKSLPIDAHFESISGLTDFLKTLGQHLYLPEDIKVLVVDDEPEIGSIIRDYLERRVKPSYQVSYAENGEKGFGALRTDRPDVIVLDIKMPVKDGREFYRDLKANKIEIPVIIFFDAISGDEMIEIHKIGKPAVVDKGSPQSSMPEMLALIKKMAYFG